MYDTVIEITVAMSAAHHQSRRVASNIPKLAPNRPTRTREY